MLALIKLINWFQQNWTVQWASVLKINLNDKNMDLTHPVVCVSFAKCKSYWHYLQRSTDNIVS